MCNDESSITLILGMFVARLCNFDVRRLNTIKFRYSEADAQGRETAGNDIC